MNGRRNPDEPHVVIALLLCSKILFSFLLPSSSLHVPSELKRAEKGCANYLAPGISSCNQQSVEMGYLQPSALQTFIF
jgi:hypothetical protein